MQAAASSWLFTSNHSSSKSISSSDLDSPFRVAREERRGPRPRAPGDGNGEMFVQCDGQRRCPAPFSYLMDQKNVYIYIYLAYICVSHVQTWCVTMHVYAYAHTCTILISVSICIRPCICTKPIQLSVCIHVCKRIQEYAHLYNKCTCLWPLMTKWPCCYQ